MNICLRILGLSDTSLSKLKNHWNWPFISVLRHFWHLAKRQVINMKATHQADNLVREDHSISSGRVLLPRGHSVKLVYTLILPSSSNLKFKFNYKKKKEIKHYHITSEIKDYHILKKDNQRQLRKSRVAILSVWKLYL